MKIQKEILTVSQLNKSTQSLLETSFSRVWVEGEISNLARPGSGHLYFTLKDAQAQVRCALFRFKKTALSFEPENGLLVHVLAKVSIYPDRGDYQLIVETLEPAGEGHLRLLYEQLVKKLEKEGLFQEQFKKPLPTFPTHIGVITSPTGAAIRDILSVLKRRFPNIPVTIYPSKVQGSDAAPELIRALALAEQHADSNSNSNSDSDGALASTLGSGPDVLILARGGGSLEDLWPFNEEAVARAIFACKIPIISGVGHEIDFTIADFVADKRAPTPSAAAELVTPNRAELLQQLYSIEQYLCKKMIQIIQNFALKIDWLQKRVRHPGQIIQTQLQQLASLYNRLLLANANYFKNKNMAFKSLTRALETMSPLSTLNRGYSIVTHADASANDNLKDKIIRSRQDVKKGNKVNVRVSDGDILCVVD